MRISIFFACTLGATAFTPLTQNFHRLHGSSQLFAGPPQYEKRNAKLRKAEVVGEGSVMLHIDNDDEVDVDYKPGNVLALEIEAPETELDEKTSGDTENNGGWMRGPYTVSRATETSFDILIKVVGDKSRTLASAVPGTHLKYGGKFKVPIFEGIDKKDTKRVVLISSGVGVGPCIGAVEEMMNDDEFSAKVELIASYRTDPEVVYQDYLDSLKEEHPDQFQWHSVITSEKGRLSASEQNLGLLSSEEFCSLNDTHYHVIGNGQMVNEFQEGLLKAGVPPEKVTIEAYFNHRAESSEERIERIANVVSSTAKVPAQ